MHPIRKLLLVATAALTLALVTPATAWAHVGVTATSTAAGSSTLLTFGFSHGCDGSPTTKVAIRMPDGINAVAPTVNSGWDVAKVMTKLETPVTDAHGNRITDRVSEVVYTAKTPVADGLRDAFVLSLTLPEDAAGKTLAFPTVQTCSKGSVEWVEVPAAGQDHDELESPAPTVDVTSAAASDDHHDAGASPSADHSTVPATTPAAAPADQTPLIVTALTLGALGLATAVWALLRGRRSA